MIAARPTRNLISSSGALPALIIDTDIGGDWDDINALVIAALTCPELVAVFTVDELDGERARLARHVLDLCGRPDVIVVAGCEVPGSNRLWSAEGLVPAGVAVQSTALLEAMDWVCEATPGPVRWLGMGPMSNLAYVLERRPALAGRLRVTQMGGTFDVQLRPKSTWSEHNLRLNTVAARQVAGRVWDLRLVTLDVTWSDRIAVDAGHEIYRLLTGSPAPWAGLMAAHLRQWIDKHRPNAKLHDPMALSAALGMPFVGFTPNWLRIDEFGRTFVDPGDPAGRPALVSTSADYDGFMAWVKRGLGLDRASSVTERAHLPPSEASAKYVASEHAPESLL